MTTLLTITAAAVIVLLLKNKIQKRRIAQQTMQLRLFRESLCKGDRVRTIDGRLLNIAHVGKDIIFVVDKYGNLELIRKETVLPLVLN